jgi:hypothetical protein
MDEMKSAGVGIDAARLRAEWASLVKIAQIIGARRAYLKGGNSSWDRHGVTGELLSRGGVRVTRIG